MKKKILIPIFILLVITGIAFYFGNAEQFKGSARDAGASTNQQLTLKKLRVLMQEAETEGTTVGYVEIAFKQNFVSTSSENYYAKDAHFAMYAENDTEYATDLFEGYTVDTDDYTYKLFTKYTTEEASAAGGAAGSMVIYYEIDDFLTSTTSTSYDLTTYDITDETEHSTYSLYPFYSYYITLKDESDTSITDAEIYLTNSVGDVNCEVNSLGAFGCPLELAEGESSSDIVVNANWDSDGDGTDDGSLSASGLIFAECSTGFEECQKVSINTADYADSSDSGESDTGTPLNNEQSNDELDFAEIDWAGDAKYTLGEWHLTSDAETVVAIPEDASELYIGDPADGVLLTDYFDITVTTSFGEWSKDTGTFTNAYTTSTGSISGPWYFAPDWDYFFEVTGTAKTDTGLEDTFDASGAAGEEVNWQIDTIDYIYTTYNATENGSDIETYAELILTDTSYFSTTEYSYSTNPEYYNFETENYTSGGYIISTEGDKDGDGLANILEIKRLGTDPEDADSDDNGTEDGEEDTDGDGTTNLEEVENGTDPSTADASDDASGKDTSADSSTGTTTYVLNLSVMDAYGNSLTGLDATAFSASTTDGGTSEVTDVIESSGTYTLYVPSSATYYVSVANDGYVTADDDFASVDSTSTTVENVYLTYTYYIDLDDDTGTYVSGATVLAGDASAITCVDSSSYVTDDANKGYYGCAIPLDDTDLSYSVSISEYQDFDGEFDSDRTAATDATVIETVTLTTADDDSADSDVDDDGLANVLEIKKFGYDPEDTDSDDDGTEDGDEDYDGDGLTNLEEIDTYETSPFESDSDEDGTDDGDEVSNGTDPLVADEEEEEEDPDYDDDGLTNDDETDTYETDPYDEDSDGDDVSDYEEIMTFETDPNDEDSDGDGFDDGYEIEKETDPLDDTDYPKTKRITEESDSPFTDIVDHWSEDYVNKLYEEGIVSGRSATLYEPDDDVTRAEFLKMIMLVAGLDPTYHTGLTVTKYSDVNPGDWYYDYVALADSYGDLWYAGSGTWQPNENITRGDAILLVMRFANQTLYDFTEDDSSFTDFDEDSYQAYAIILAEQYEIITGYDDGEFKPDNSITRAEAAVVVSKSEEALF